MTNSPDAIRADIERTRRELGSDVDALTDKVTPSKIVHRQTSKVKGAVGSVKDRVMGVASDVRENAADATHSASGKLGATPSRAADATHGNPIAVGLIAFGIGWLAASLVPASDKEKEVAASVKDAAQPIVDDAAEAVKETAENLKEPAEHAAERVKESAAEAVGHVKDEAATAADTVKSDAADAKDTVQENQR